MSDEERFGHVRGVLTHGLNIIIDEAVDRRKCTGVGVEIAP